MNKTVVLYCPVCRSSQIHSVVISVTGESRLECEKCGRVKTDLGGEYK